MGGINSFSRPPQSFIYLGFHENWDNPQVSNGYIYIIYISPWGIPMAFSLAHWERHGTELSPGAPGSVQTTIGFISIGVILLAVVALGEHHLRGDGPLVMGRAKWWAI